MDDEIKEKYDKLMLFAPKKDEELSRAVFKDYLNDLLKTVSQKEFNYAYDKGLEDAFKDE